MAIAHIIIEVEESPDLTDCTVRMTYSGGGELQTPEAQTAFQKTVEAVEQVLQS